MVISDPTHGLRWGRGRGRPSLPRGFTYLALLFWIAIAGVALAALGQAWHLEMRRQREDELRFRGMEIARALGRYAAGHEGRYPRTLDALLADEASGRLVRHLRRPYADPITGSKDWGLVVDENGGIVAVYSASPRPTVRLIDGVQAYEDWKFQAVAPAAAPRAAASSPPEAASSPFGGRAME